MDIDITDLFHNVDPTRYSASQAELGPDAGTITWARAKDRAATFHPPILRNAEELAAFHDFVFASGGWSRAELHAMTNNELQALCLQWIAGDMREAGLDAASTDEDWARYEIDVNDGRVPGNIYRGDDGRVYFNIE